MGTKISGTANKAPETGWWLCLYVYYVQWGYLEGGLKQQKMKIQDNQKV